jgi:hypothetical protein
MRTEASTALLHSVENNVLFTVTAAIIIMLQASKNTETYHQQAYILHMMVAL